MTPVYALNSVILIRKSNRENLEDEYFICTFIFTDLGSKKNTLNAHSIYFTDEDSARKTKFMKYLAVQLNQFVAITLSSTKSEKTPLSTGNFSFITLMLQLQQRSNVFLHIDFRTHGVSVRTV